MKITIIVLIVFLYFQSGDCQWVQQTTGTGFDIFDISFPNSQTGFICGYGNMFKRTNNGGLNWTDLSFPGTANNFNAVNFINPQTGFLASTNDTVYKTTDGGNTWYYKYNIGYQAYNFQFLDSLKGYVCGMNRLSFTSNGGQNWLTLNIPTYGSIYFLNQLTGWTVNYISAGSEIRKTTDGGNTWVTQYTTDNFRILYDVYFANENTGWACGYRHSIFKTINGGMNWTAQNELANAGGLYSISFINPDTGWAVGDSYGSGTQNSYYTINGGAVWTSMPGIITGGRIFRIRTKTSPVLWICSQYGLVFKSINNGGLTVIRNENGIPANYTLTQNYPNPFNPVTRINYTIPERSLVSILIFDITGRKITTIFKGFRAPGEYSLEIDGTNLSNGVYFYSLETSNYKSVKKMILLK